MMGLLGTNIIKSLKGMNKLKQKYIVYTPVKNDIVNESYENWKFALKKFYL